MAASDKPARRSLGALARLAGRASGRNRTKQVQGFVDAVVRGDTIVGWARDMLDPSRRLEIQILHGNEIMGFGIADLPRKDLVTAEIGDGRYGFRLRLSPLLLDGTSRDLRICAATERGKVLLERGTLTIAGTPTPEPLHGPKPDAHALVGAIERLNGRALHGWAFNPNQPDVPALVDVYDDERYLGSVTADRSRPRLYEKGFPSGARGFVFELPAITPGLVDRLRARVAGTMYELKRTRDFAERALPDHGHPEIAVAPGETLEASPQPAPVPDSARSPAPRSEEGARRGVAALPVPDGPAPVGLWPVGAWDEIGPAIEDWAAQRHAALRIVATGAAPLPARLASRPTRIEGRRLVEQVARETGFTLFARTDVRLDTQIAGTIATLTGFPDVVVLDGGRPSMSGDAARIETFLAPSWPGALAVRSDLLMGYPGNLERDLAEGLLSPLRLWLAQRTDLDWTRLVVPAIGAGKAEAAGGGQARAWRAVAPEDRWRIVGNALLPADAPRRLSIGLWTGWDAPDVPALRAVIAGIDVPLDILVPTEGDAARGAQRLAAADAAVAASGVTAARTRIVDCGNGPEATCAALLAAADGDVVLLSDGSVTPDAGTLRRMAAWSLHPHVGIVAPATERDPAGGAVIVPGPALEGTDTDGGGAVADMAGFGLMMIATRCLGAIGGPAFDRYDIAFAPLEYGLRLARQGFQTVIVRGQANGAASRPPPIGPIPWHVVARLRADRLIGGG